jgi:hypothetical protein
MDQSFATGTLRAFDAVWKILIKRPSRTKPTAEHVSHNDDCHSHAFDCLTLSEGLVIVSDSDHIRYGR